MSSKYKFLLLATAIALQVQLSTSANLTSWYPKYHIAPQQGWLNDPNGLSYFNGSYHAFWQYHPDAPVHGLMYWGHARSTDLLNWEHLPIALSPSLPEDIDGIFSGSAVIRDGNLTAVYTGVSENSTRQRQMAAVSEDGIVFKKLGVILDRDGNETDFRDPKVWYQNGSWFVVIGSQTADQRGEALLYRSEDFFNWTYQGPLAQADEKLGYMWECPDFFTLGGKQILVINPQGVEQDGYDYVNLYQTGYFVGTWEPGTNYTIEKEFREIDHGHDFYAAQTFLGPDGRRILIGWLDMWESQFPENTTGWSGMLTLPRVVTLSESGDLEMRPVREVFDQRTEVFANKGVLQHIHTDSGPTLFSDDAIHANEVVVDFNLRQTTADIFGVELDSIIGSNEGLRIYVNRSEGRLFLERNYPQYDIELSTRSVKVDLDQTSLSLDLFFDESSVEVFVNNGSAVMSSRIYPNDDQRFLYLFANPNINGSDTKLIVNGFAIYEL